MPKITKPSVKDNAHIFTSAYDAIKYINEVCNAEPTTNLNYKLYVFAGVTKHETTEHFGRKMIGYRWQVKKTYSVACFGSKAAVHIKEEHFSLVNKEGECDVDGVPSIHADIDKDYWLSLEEYNKHINVHNEMLSSLSGEHGE